MFSRCDETSNKTYIHNYRQPKLLTLRLNGKSTIILTQCVYTGLMLILTLEECYHCCITLFQTVNIANLAFVNETVLCLIYNFRTYKIFMRGEIHVTICSAKTIYKLHFLILAICRAIYPNCSIKTPEVTVKFECALLHPIIVNKRHYKYDITRYGITRHDTTIC